VAISIWEQVMNDQELDDGLENLDIVPLLERRHETRLIPCWPVDPTAGAPLRYHCVFDHTKYRETGLLSASVGISSDRQNFCCYVLGCTFRGTRQQVIEEIRAARRRKAEASVA
jgi:hypothetical protein